jgi:protoporphyrinogen oxidase
MKWAIVGGGMMGLTLAYRLLHRRQQVVVLEAAPVIGGLTSAWQIGDVVWDRFYHVTLLSDTNLRTILREIGLESQIRWVETKTGFYTQGHLYSMSNSWEYLKFPPLSFWQKIRLAVNILYASRVKDWRDLESVPVEPWLRRWSGRATTDKLWLPLIRSKLGEMYHKTSAAFIWAYIQRMYKARQTGLKKEMFGYVPGGYARVLDHMRASIIALGGEIRLSMPVHRIGNWSNEQLLVESTGDQSELFDRVVLTAPSPLVSRICSGMSEDERTKHDSIEYLGIVCASLLLRKPLSPYYVTNILDNGLPMTGVIEMTTIVDPAELCGHHLVYLPRYASSRDVIFESSDDELQRMFIAGLAHMYPNFDRADVLAIKIARARYVMALPTLNYSRNLPPMKTSVPGLYTVNSSYIVKGNLNVNETIDVAERAIRDFLDPDIARQSQTVAKVDLVTPN